MFFLFGVFAELLGKLILLNNSQTVCLIFFNIIYSASVLDLNLYLLIIIIYPDNICYILLSGF